MVPPSDTAPPVLSVPLAALPPLLLPASLLPPQPASAVTAMAATNNALTNLFFIVKILLFSMYNKYLFIILLIMFCLALHTTEGKSLGVVLLEEREDQHDR